MAQYSNKDQGTNAEQWVADKIGGERVPNEWYDVRGPDGEIIEVKSTVYKYDYSSRYGRFRLWADQHMRLKANDGEYWLMVEGMNPAVLDPVEINEIKEEYGLQWTDAGHRREENQLKLVWRHVEQLGDQAEF